MHASERFSTMLTRYLKRHGDAPGDDVSLAVGRVWRRLEPHALHMPAHQPPRHSANYAWRVTFATLAAAAVFVLAATPLMREWTSTNPARAVVDSADGSVYRTANGESAMIPVGGSINTGERIRTNGNAGAVLALADGSRVEMRTQSELSLERADDGIRIRLRSGSIIVNAAKQRTGHLYVQTKDMSVSVVGTIFLVNVENAGSSVAVIEGEVRVRETKGTNETKLRPGEQIASSAALVTRPVKEEIAWSRNAAAHISILDAFMSGMAATRAPLSPIARVIDPATAASPQNSAAGARQEFEEASIRPCDPDNLPSTPEGARGGGPNSFQMTPGRTHVLCMTLATIIRTAYQIANLDRPIGGGSRGRGLNFNNIYGLGVEDGSRVRGGPDWVRTERYTIDAVANDKTDAETMRGPMLAALLERRFQLKVHEETEQVPVFGLTISTDGLKMKPVVADGVDANGFVRSGVKNEACDALPEPQRGQPTTTVVSRSFEEVRRGAKPSCGLFGSRNGPNIVFVGGGVPLSSLTFAAATALGLPGRVTVLDQTNSTERFNFILEFTPDENAIRRGATPPEPSNIPPAPRIFAALEEQLGLTLQPTRAPREYIVIDSVERLSPN